MLETDPTHITWLLLTFGLAGAFGNWLGGWLTDRIGADRCVVIGLIGASVGLFVIPLVGQVWTSAVVAVAIWGVGGWITIPALEARLMHLSGPAAPMAISLNTSAMYLGIGIAALLGNATISVSGLNALGAFMGILVLALHGIFSRGERRVPRTSSVST